MAGFIPEDFDIKQSEVPWFENASSELGIKGHGTKKSVDTLKTEIKAAMSSLGGGVTAFLHGHWNGPPQRYGFEIRFNYGSHEGRMQIACLPMKHETPSRKEQCLKQALFTIRDVLESQFNAGIMMPGNMPLVGYMMDDKGRTMAEVLSEQGVPLLSPPISEGTSDDVVEGEFREDD